MEIVTPTRIHAADGGILADSGLVAEWVAVADLNSDGTPEIISVASNRSSNLHDLNIWNYDSTAPSGILMVRTQVDINGTLDPSTCVKDGGGGPPMVADINGDSIPDIGVPGGLGYAAFSGAALMDPSINDADTLLWIQPTLDCGSGTVGAVAADLNGDGITEVIHVDELNLRFFSGSAGGEVVFETCNTDTTLWENPIVADVDNDGHADLITIANHYTAAAECEGAQQTGLRIWGAASGEWMPTRNTWNEHGYHHTNVLDDGYGIPNPEEPHWAEVQSNFFVTTRRRANLTHSRTSKYRLSRTAAMEVMPFSRRSSIPVKPPLKAARPWTSSPVPLPKVV